MSAFAPPPSRSRRTMKSSLLMTGHPTTRFRWPFSLYQKDKRVRVIDLSRNFGHHKAIMTGLSHARGELVFLIDSDLIIRKILFGALLQGWASLIISIWLLGGMTIFCLGVPKSSPLTERRQFPAHLRTARSGQQVYSMVHLWLSKSRQKLCRSHKLTFGAGLRLHGQRFLLRRPHFGGYFCQNELAATMRQGRVLRLANHRAGRL
jgi:hypothetical protein